MMKKIIFAVIFLFVILSTDIFGQSNNKTLDGIWQLTTNQDVIFIFCGDTWRVLQDNEIIANGVFSENGQNSIFCIVEEGKWFEFGYSLTENTLTIINSRQNLWMVGQWKKISSGSDLIESNQIIGTWKSIIEEKITIYQFYSNGTGVEYEFNSADITSLKRNDMVSYEFTNAASGKLSVIIGDFFTFKLIFDFEIKKDDLIINTRVYTRE
jgi:hypothetical protein